MGRKRKGAGVDEDYLDSWIGHERFMGKPRELALEIIRRERLAREEKAKNPPPKKVHSEEEISKQVEAARRGHARYHPGQDFDESAIRAKFGAGWEDMLKEAMERDNQNEADKASAAKIRDAAAADAKKRTGGKVRRKRCKTCGSLPKRMKTMES